MTFAIIAGTRPEIIKQYPIMRLLDRDSIEYRFIYTGQHYDYELSDQFIEEFRIRKPDYHIKLSNPSDPVRQVAEIMTNVGNIIQEINSSLVIVQGDTNSVLASALAAVKSGVKIAHVEAGLRSYNWKMYEEHNRRIVDHMSDILFAPTEESAYNLKNEQVHGDIYTTGNTVIDAVELYFHQLQSDNRVNNKYSNDNNYNDGGVDYNGSSKATRRIASSLPLSHSSLLKRILRNIKFKKRISVASSQIRSGVQNNKNYDDEDVYSYDDVYDFVLVTLHRSENVDNADFLKKALNALSESGLQYIFPMHPHTVKRIHEFGLENLIAKNIRVVEPVGYFHFLMLLKMCRFVITDSGGVQEEITSPFINKRAIVVRDFTERPESVQSGHSILCKADKFHILGAIRKLEIMDPQPENTCPYGSGKAAEVIIEILKKSYVNQKRISRM